MQLYLISIKKIYKNIVKNRPQFLVTPTNQTTDAMTLKFYTDTNLLSKAYQLEGFLNRNKIDRMVNNHLSSCNSHWFKNTAQDRFRILATPPG